jgi:ADP-ribose pyrophosphatase
MPPLGPDCTREFRRALLSQTAQITLQASSSMEPPEDEELFVARRFRVVRRRQQLAGGGEVLRETIQHPGAVVILPLLPDDHVCLILNDRIAVRETLIELPAGTLDRDEAPLETARRELREETGYDAGQIEPLGEWLMSPGILNERMHFFVARELTAGATELETGEEIRPLVVPWSEAIEMVRTGQIQDAKTVAALLFYERFHRR